ncbi:hypothetical protein ETD86_07040 [Nonomuraea turkmeniaca]|uniref:Tyr recombinase domain-containing protein n=1 Tax=Nonomuraea turkmeniaca TaxID=103838 RepID=A0A5S4FSZ4_9ACTN|nr:hypothetical protein [Nonomuraea turkmeniaca]TMR23742.1 hypothetical protein ETD86_07040 [Nonomuraea turkmeniaca]
MRQTLPARFRAMVDAGAGLGLRQGEILGLSPDDLGWPRDIVTIQRQIKVWKGRLYFAPPKGGKMRQAPLPQSVKHALATQMEEFAPVTVTLPWQRPDGVPHTTRLFFSMPGNAYGGAIHKDRINHIWHAASRACSISPRAEPLPAVPAGDQHHADVGQRVAVAGHHDAPGQAVTVGRVDSVDLARLEHQPPFGLVGGPLAIAFEPLAQGQFLGTEKSNITQRREPTLSATPAQPRRS